MNPVTEYIATITHGDIKIMAYYTKERNENLWEVYYRKPDYPFMFAFGLDAGLLSEEVLDIAIKNIDNYADMFD